MLRVIIMSVLIIGSRICFGQQDSISKRTSISPKIKVSYISSLVYPGISTGIEFLKKEKAGSNLKIRNQLLTFNLNWYHHPGFHDNIYLTSEWVIRKMKKKGFYSEFSAGPGYSRTFLGGTTYRVGDNGKVSIKKYAGYNYALVTIGGGIGYYFNYMKKVPLSAYAKMNLISMFPYNSTFYIRPVMELGLRFPASRRTEIKSHIGSDNLKIK